MDSREFDAYKTRYRGAIQQVLSDTKPRRLEEIGLPAYSHTNPLINWLFWKRIHTVMDYLEQQAPYRRVLDFGCGSGVMLPFLERVSQEVVAADVDLVALMHMKRHIALSPRVKIQDLHKHAISRLPAASFDLIVALDVLEHVRDLSGTLSQLMRLLKRGAELVISGPTENVMYQFGRRLAGPEFSGDYHERGIGEIRSALAKQAKLKRIATLYWPVPLFEIFAASA